MGVGLAADGAYRRYVLAAMTAVYMLSAADRALIILLLEPIKRDLHLTDTQLGFLTGIAFGLFYATLGVPVARWADRGSRVTLSALAIGIWGLTVMACMFVTSYVQLVLVRILAAIGESGGKPPTYSLVGDYFPRPAERTRALAIYMTGSPLSSLFSFMAGGWLNAHYGWRATFFVAGIPALLLALVVRFTVKEPRVDDDAIFAKPQPSPAMRTVLTCLWNNHSLRHLCIALILLYTLGLGMAPWYAAFMMRVHGTGTAQIGWEFGLIFGLGGIAGTLLGGYLAAARFGNNERGQMRMSAVMVALILPCFVSFLTLPGQFQALGALVLLLIVFSSYLGPSYAIMQRLVPDEMRATMLAVVMLLANLIGFGLGPQIVGVLSDMLVPTFGAESLRYALLALSFVALWAAYHFWKVGDTVQRDLCGAG